MKQKKRNRKRRKKERKKKTTTQKKKKKERGKKPRAHASQIQTKLKPNCWEEPANNRGV